VTYANPTGTRLINPFPGLRPFHENEEHLFFGRESQIDTMVDKLAATRFLAVVGSSGSGKSSLVNCGLKPALSRGLMASAGTSWRMAQFRPGGDPIKAMAHALARPDGLFRGQDVGGMTVEEIVEATLRMSKLGLVDIYEQGTFDERPNLLVVVDQFEEFFRYRNLQSSPEQPSAGEDKAVAFVNLLLEAASSDFPIYVVLTMRSDFLGDCSRFAGLPEAINRGQYLVPRMSRDERRSAIAGPVAVAEGEITPVLLNRLVNDVGDNPDQLSILQHALNRTWAQWQRQGGVAAMDLPHYEAIGTMSRALDLHAESAFEELRDDRQRMICERVFQALTDKGPYQYGVRRPTSAETLCAINDATLDELKLVLDVFRKPSRSFVMPPITEPIAPETIIDISHESLMRIWNRLNRWVDEEAESADHYQRLAQNMSLFVKGAAGLMTDPELSLMLEWQQNRQPNAAWGERYKPGFAPAIAFLDASRQARDVARAAERERQRRELRRTRQIAAVLGTAFLLAVGFGGYALYEQRRAAVEQVARQQSDALREAEEKLAQEQERARQQAEALNQRLTVALDVAEKAKAEAEAADARAEHERDLATRTAQMFIAAIKAQAGAQLAAFEQLEKEEILQQDRDAKKAAAALDQDKRELDTATTKAKQLSLEAAHKSAEAAAIVANAHLLSPSQISGSDLFDVGHGEAQVTGYSGAGNTRNPNDMFSGATGSPDHATVFADGQQVGTEHWIEWKTKKEVTLKSVGLFAAHDAIRLRRSFSTFKLFVKKNGQWSPVTEYSPALMYGGSCGAQPCFPPPAIKYAPGTVLASCINVPPTTGQEFRAVFVQSVSSIERFSGPRVLQLDGYKDSNCSK
jgi:energy-coupling factor transporter ATP-binding protein EcfA2